MLFTHVWVETQQKFTVWYDNVVGYQKKNNAHTHNPVLEKPSIAGSMDIHTHYTQTQLEK